MELELDFKKAELKWNDIHTPHFIFLYKLPINMDYFLKHYMILIINAWNDILYIANLYLFDYIHMYVWYIIFYKFHFGFKTSY